MCDNCPARFFCIIACSKVNEILAKIDIELEKEEMEQNNYVYCI